MVSPAASDVMIECPHCGTRYQLPADTVGPKGRQVSCAHCGKAWRAIPEPVSAAMGEDCLFDAEAEADLDAAFAAVEAETLGDKPAPREAAPGPPDTADVKSVAAPGGVIKSIKPMSAAGLRALQQAFRRRQADVNRRLPIAKVRRLLRLSLLLLLVGLVVAGILFRIDIVRRVPDLAGVYETMGLGVNVVGLEFRDVSAMISVRDGGRLVRVEARIYSVAAQTLPMPRVLVTLLDADGNSLYQWSAEPEARQLRPGEVTDFSTRLSGPPVDSMRARLTFIPAHRGAAGSVGAVASIKSE